MMCLSSLTNYVGPKDEDLHYITLHYVISYANHTYSDQWCINKVIQVLRMRVYKGEFSKVFEIIRVCKLLEIGRKRISCLRSGERETPLAEF